ncbi:MAG: hypothetical protein M3R52_04260 [Acidobacteriota bacterium]|nr:hypothetical protein [Acidobacteriota bacterium]
MFSKKVALCFIKNLEWRIRFNPRFDGNRRDIKPAVVEDFGAKTLIQISPLRVESYLDKMLHTKTHFGRQKGYGSHLATLRPNSFNAPQS